MALLIRRGAQSMLLYGVKCCFQASCELSATVERVFAFHAEPENISIVSPWYLTVSRVTHSDRLEVGEKVQVEATLLGIPQNWLVRWEIIEAPAGSPPKARLVDIALESPFAYWRHEHLFEAIESGTRMTDRIEFTLPFGILGMMGVPGALLQLSLLFRHRHRETARLLSKEGS